MNLSAVPDISNPKKGRRTIAEIERLYAVVQAKLAEQTGRIPIRHLWYLVVMTRAVQNTHRAYQNFVHMLVEWRRERKIPYAAFIDDARGYIGREGWASERDFLNAVPYSWRQDFWADRPDYVQIWTEKNAIARILLEGADPWHVKVLPVRGFSSLSCLYDAAQEILAKQAEGKMVYVYQFGDWDPSGIEIDKTLVEALGDDFDVDLTQLKFERIAVTRAQIRQLGLPSIPTKDNSKSGHGLGFEGDSVEVDAVPRDVLIGLVRQCLTRHIPEDERARLQADEDARRERLRRALRRIRL